jgi:hypothetical protein
MGALNLQGVGVFNYFERPGSPNEQYSGDTFRATRTFDVPWYARWAFIRYMLGVPTLVGNFAISRELPDQYYAFFGGTTNNLSTPKAFMVANSLNGIECLGQQSETANGVGPGTKITYCMYDWARITIGYESVTYNVKSDAEIGLGSSNEYGLRRFTTVFRQPTAEFLTLPFGAFKWVELDDNGREIIDLKTGQPTGIRVSGSNGKIVAAAEVILVHHKVPGVPDAIRTHIGTVNLFDWPEIGALKGQLLLSNVELKPYRWLNEKRLFDITYKFKFMDPDPKASLANPTMPRGHNWFLQHFPVSTTSKLGADINELLQGDPKYKLMTSNGKLTGRTVYQYADFKDLFKYYAKDIQPE